LIPLNHGTNEHPSIYAEIARLLYVPYLAADLAYIHENHFYGRALNDWTWNYPMRESSI
jgi:hypothetical protein